MPFSTLETELFYNNLSKTLIDCVMIDVEFAKEHEKIVDKAFLLKSINLQLNDKIDLMREPSDCVHGDCNELLAAVMRIYISKINLDEIRGALLADVINKLNN